MASWIRLQDTRDGGGRSGRWGLQSAVRTLQAAGGEQWPVDSPQWTMMVNGRCAVDDERVVDGVYRRRAGGIRQQCPPLSRHVRQPSLPGSRHSVSTPSSPAAAAWLAGKWTTPRPGYQRSRIRPLLTNTFRQSCWTSGRHTSRCGGARESERDKNTKGSARPVAVIFGLCCCSKNALNIHP